MIVKVISADTSIDVKGVLYTLGAEIDVTVAEYNNIKSLVSVTDDVDEDIAEDNDVKIEIIEVIDAEPTSYEELRARAKAEGIKGYHKMSADELREVLEVE